MTCRARYPVSPTAHCPGGHLDPVLRDPVAVAFARLGVTDTRLPLGDDLLELGAREAVTRICRGDMSAETYAAELLRQYEAHRDLNAVAAIDQACVLEIRAGSRSVARTRSQAGGRPQGRRWL